MAKLFQLASICLIGAVSLMSAITLLVSSFASTGPAAPGELYQNAFYFSTDKGVLLYSGLSYFTVQELTSFKDVQTALNSTDILQAPDDLFDADKLSKLIFRNTRSSPFASTGKNWSYAYDDATWHVVTIRTVKPLSLAIICAASLVLLFAFPISRGPIYRFWHRREMKRRGFPVGGGRNFNERVP